MIFVPKHIGTSPRRRHSLLLVSCFLFIHAIATIHKTAGLFAKDSWTPFSHSAELPCPSLFARPWRSKGHHNPPTWADIRGQHDLRGLPQSFGSLFAYHVGVQKPARSSASPGVRGEETRVPGNWPLIAWRGCGWGVVVRNAIQFWSLPLLMMYVSVWGGSHSNEAPVLCRRNTLSKTLDWWMKHVTFIAGPSSPLAFSSSLAQPRDFALSSLSTWCSPFHLSNSRSLLAHPISPRRCLLQIEQEAKVKWSFL
jgi:hypothetical protein